MRVLLLQEHCSIAWDWLQLGTEGLAPSTSELSVQCSTFKLRSYSWLGVLLIKRRLFLDFHLFLRRPVTPVYTAVFHLLFHQIYRSFSYPSKSYLLSS